MAQLAALNPNQAVAFRWRLAVSDQSTPLVFSVLISKADSPCRTDRRQVRRAATGPASGEIRYYLA